MSNMSNVGRGVESTESQRKILAAEWGWSNPSNVVLQMAEKSLFAQQSKSGEILVQWGVIDAKSRDRMLNAKPADVPTMKFFAQQEPVRVLPYVEQALALKNGYPFYEQLSILDRHPSMSEPNVIKRCDELDVVLMVIDGTESVLVFSQWESLLKYSTLGRSRMTDALVSANHGVVPLMAVGSRDDISSVLKMHHDVTGDMGVEAGAKVWNAASGEMDTPEARELARLFDHALSKDATDIAFKPFRNGSVQVMIRKWGHLVTPFKEGFKSNENKEAPKKENTFFFGPDIASKATNLLMSHSGANPSATRMKVPSDGQITYKSTTADAFMRLNFLPLNHLMELKDLRSVSIRLFNRTESSIVLEDLNIPENVAGLIRDAIRMPQGLILLSGPVNSGKSSTIAAAIGEHVKVYGDSKKRLSVEDPIERYVYGITQINVPTHIKDQDDRYNVILRAIKRHDLNVLWVGEVRDHESAEFCVGFAGSGHLVFSTIHAKDTILAYDILSHMVDPGVRFQLAESMALSVSQRIVRTLCPHCSTKNHVPNDEDRRLFALNLKMLGENAELPATLAKANPAGCDMCDEGYAGSLPICEVLPFTREVKDAAIALMSGENVREQRRIIALARPVTLLTSGLELLKEGKVDLGSILFF